MLNEDADAVIKVHTDTDPEKPGLTWVPDFMMPRILSTGPEQVILWIGLCNSFLNSSNKEKNNL